jgi:hypothetical protein
MSRAVLSLALVVGAFAAKNSIVAPQGADVLTVALLGGEYSSLQQTEDKLINNP